MGSQGKIAPMAVLLASCVLADQAMAAVPERGREIKLGVFRNDAGLVTATRERSVNANAEILFVSPEFLNTVWSPRPHLGAHVNLGEDTDQLYGGLTWSFDLGRRFFIEASLGFALHDAPLETAKMDRKELGLRALFRESLALGYRLDESWSVEIMADHISNANLGKHNHGLDTVGMRVGYRF